MRYIKLITAIVLFIIALVAVLGWSTTMFQGCGNNPIVSVG